MALQNFKFRNIALLILYLYLMILPLGQLTKFGTLRNIGNLGDVVVMFSLPFLFPYIKKTPSAKYFLIFIFSCLFSLILYWRSFGGLNELFAGLYLVRLIAYYSFFAMMNYIFESQPQRRIPVLKHLIISVSAAALFGWIQYLTVPDLTFLKYLNWDDHLNRLAGTFLDPGFTGIILAIGSLISLYLFNFKKEKMFLMLFVFLAVSVFFTYSRASILGLMAGVFMFLFKARAINLKSVMLSVSALIIMLVLLPKAAGEGTKLFRSSSIIARYDAYLETREIIIRNPLFGIGFNNFCPYNAQILGRPPVSHACSGTDSSLLFLAATTGIVGLILFLQFIRQTASDFDLLGNRLFLSVSVAVFIHSLFVQSVFYPFVMGILAISFAAVGRFRGNK